MQLRIVPRRVLHLRMPERQGEKPNHRLRLRTELQVRPNVFLQETVNVDGTLRIPRGCDYDKFPFGYDRFQRLSFPKRHR